MFLEVPLTTKKKIYEDFSTLNKTTEKLTMCEVISNLKHMKLWTDINTCSRWLGTWCHNSRLELEDMFRF